MGTPRALADSQGAWPCQDKRWAFNKTKQETTIKNLITLPDSEIWENLFPCKISASKQMAFASLGSGSPRTGLLGRARPFQSEESASSTLSVHPSRLRCGDARGHPLGRRGAQVSGAAPPHVPPAPGCGVAPAGQPAWEAPGWEVPRPPGRDPLIRFSHYIVRFVRQSKQHSEQSGGRGAPGSLTPGRALCSPSMRPPARS